MSKLKDKYAKGKQSLEERINAKEKAEEGGQVENPFPKASGPVHGSVTTMKIEMQRLEIEKLRDGSPTMKVSTDEVRPSTWANRHPDSFLTADFQELKKEIESAGGNIQPIKVRPIDDGSSPGVKYEIVFGHRRYEACRQLDLPVLIMIGRLSDESLFVEMDRENRARKDLSAWEQGVMYRRALSSGLFPSNRKLADAIGADLGAVGKAIGLAELPEEIVMAFPSPMDLQFRWAKPLKDAVESDLKGVTSRAVELAMRTPKMKAADVFAELVGRVKKGGLNGSTPIEPVIVVGQAGQSAAIKVDARGHTAIEFKVELSSAKREKLTKILEEFMRLDLTK